MKSELIFLTWLNQRSKKLKIKYKNIVLRDMIPEDLDQEVIWHTRETEWNKWDAPWEKVVLDLRKITLRSLEGLPEDVIRNSFRLCAEDEKHIGKVIRYQINGADYDNNEIIDDKTAIGITIYDPTYWSKGYGTMALIAWIKYLYNNGFQELYTQTWSGNERFLKLAKKVGFEEVLRLKDFRQVNGKNYDALTFKLNNDKFFEMVKNYDDEGTNK